MYQVEFLWETYKLESFFFVSIPRIQGSFMSGFLISSSLRRSLCFFACLRDGMWWVIHLLDLCDVLIDVFQHHPAMIIHFVSLFECHLILKSLKDRSKYFFPFSLKVHLRYRSKEIKHLYCYITTTCRGVNPAWTSSPVVKMAKFTKLSKRNIGSILLNFMNLFIGPPKYQAFR